MGPAHPNRRGPCWNSALHINFSGNPLGAPIRAQQGLEGIGRLPLRESDPVKPNEEQGGIRDTLERTGLRS